MADPQTKQVGDYLVVLDELPSVYIHRAADVPEDADALGPYTSLGGTVYQSLESAVAAYDKLETVEDVEEFIPE